MKTDAFIGIDPGITGAAILLAGGSVEIYDFTDVKGAAHQINIWRTEFNLKGAALENPPLRGAGGKGLLSSKFIINLGQWEGILAAYYIDYLLVHPATWQKKYKHMGSGIWSKKDRSIRLAQKICPQLAHKVCLKRHEHRADAILMAFYCKDMFSYSGTQKDLISANGRG